MSEKYSEFGETNVRQADTIGPSISKIVQLHLRGSEDYDPLQDAEVLNMLRDYYKSGVGVLFGNDVARYEKHRDAISTLSDEEAGELGLKAPCYFIRSPATEVTQKVDKIRYSLGA